LTGKNTIDNLKGNNNLKIDIYLKDESIKDAEHHSDDNIHVIENEDKEKKIIDQKLVEIVNDVDYIKR
jgi:hypothetical protein